MLVSIILNYRHEQGTSKPTGLLGSSRIVIPTVMPIAALALSTLTIRITKLITSSRYYYYRP